MGGLKTPTTSNPKNAQFEKSECLACQKPSLSFSCSGAACSFRLFICRLLFSWLCTSKRAIVIADADIKQIDPIQKHELGSPSQLPGKMSCRIYKRVFMRQNAAYILTIGCAIRWARPQETCCAAKSWTPRPPGESWQERYTKMDRKCNTWEQKLCGTTSTMYASIRAPRHAKHPASSRNAKRLSTEVACVVRPKTTPFGRAYVGLAE